MKRLVKIYKLNEKYSVPVNIIECTSSELSEMDSMIKGNFSSGTRHYLVKNKETTEAYQWFRDNLPLLLIGRGSIAPPPQSPNANMEFYEFLQNKFFTQPQVNLQSILDLFDYTIESGNYYWTNEFTTNMLVTEIGKNKNEYRMPIIEINGTTSYGGITSAYGSGTGSNISDFYYIQYTNAYIYVSDSSKYYTYSMDGYYNYNPRLYFYWSDSAFYREIVDTKLLKVLNSSESLDPEQISNDPYNQGGESSSGGGTGNFDGTSDNIGIPSLPTLSAVDTGFITLFNPSISQLQTLSNYMWSDAFDLDTFKKLFADPMSTILGLSIVPVNVPNGATTEVKVGNISTGVQMTKASTQYVEIDCGTLNVNEYWGAYLDYDPYTKAEIYLPYIGTHPLAVDDIMNKPVHVVYHVDILSGACVAYVQCGGSVLYSFIGQCTSSIPVTGNDWTNVINGVLSIAGSIGTMVATGGISAPSSIANIASTAVNSMKPNVEKSGALSGTGGMLGVQTPYLILTRPKQAIPRQQNKYLGYPSFINSNLGELSGYTEVESIHIENIQATSDELDEIERLLKSGVIL